ncbi:9644_t:CDS:2 [Diversispora eburnea]|uniref:9644_t:CDS:1 n=1 Tax=Diversispora eburnea TaxID=1213867 RepID=A0A9N9C6I8_9GLOM|nr:9644_t:CDS:2 [Diversispora eburnea]
MSLFWIWYDWKSGRTVSPSNGDPSRKAQILNQTGFQVEFKFEERYRCGIELFGNEAQNGWQTSTKTKYQLIWVRRAPSSNKEIFDRFESEHICWDPKDGELFQAHSGSDVKIDRRIWDQYHIRKLNEGHGFEQESRTRATEEQIGQDLIEQGEWVLAEDGEEEI